MPTPIDAMLSTIEWQATNATPPADGSLFATHEGTLDIGGFVFRCYQLNDGRRVFNAEDIDRFFGFFTGDEQPAD